MNQSAAISRFSVHGQEPCDGELLQRFISSRDEQAFSQLLSRHGSMLFGMARRLVGNAADADDVCQAAFLLLARKATSLRLDRSLAGWLTGVVRKLSADVRKIRSRRVRHERVGAILRNSQTTNQADVLLGSHEIGKQMDAVLFSLPQRYREPLLLCYWEGLSKAQASARLGWKEGTLSGRLARAKLLMQKKLLKQGIAPALTAAWFGGAGQSQAMPHLVSPAVAEQALLGQATIQPLSSSVLQLYQGAVHSMFLSKIQLAVAGLITLLALPLLGWGIATQLQADDPQLLQPIITLPAAQADNKPAQNDQDKLQGMWYCVSVALGGKLPAEAQTQADKLRDSTWFEFKGDTVRMSGSPAEKNPVSFTIDSSKSPRQITIAAGEFKLHGIYSLEAGLLVICFTDDPTKEQNRPASFALGKDSTGVLFILQRERLPAQAQANAPAFGIAQSTPMAVAENHAKMLGIAMHNYAAVYNTLPDNVYDKDGKPLLSWRIRLLPYLEGEGNIELYNKFKLNEPWDSPHNKALLPFMPKEFHCPTTATEPEKKPATTPFRAFFGKETLHQPNKSFNFASVTDGLSNTILFVEAAEAVPWTSPNDLPFDRSKPFPKVGGRFGNSFIAIMCDGSLRKLDVPDEQKGKLYLQLVTPASGEVVELHEVQKKQ